MSFNNNSQIPDINHPIGKRYDAYPSGHPTQKGLQDIAEIMMPYSKDTVETFRYLFIKSGVIEKQIAVTVDVPSMTYVGSIERLLDIKHKAEENLCFLVLVHNHPSGNFRPSKADIETTNYLYNIFSLTDDFSLIVGHIILGDDFYSLLLSGGLWVIPGGDSFIPLV